jgi:hypothetical protein
VKADLVVKIRAVVRAMGAEAHDHAPAAPLVTTPVHPDLVAFVERADQDWPGDEDYALRRAYGKREAAVEVCSVAAVGAAISLGLGLTITGVVFGTLGGAALGAVWALMFWIAFNDN